MRIGNRVAVYGLTVTELLIVIACLLLFAAVLLPAITRSKARSSRLNCGNNMKQVSLAFHTWGLDSLDRFPMQVPVASGGTLELVGNGTVFAHFQVMSNELSTPKILHCPNDTKRTSATNFEVGFGDANLSYFVGLDSVKGQNSSLLFGDRNLTNGRAPGSAWVKVTTNLGLGWNKELHSEKGYVGFGDGSVQLVRNGFLSKGTNRLAVP
jgi:hypothetical protein